MNFEQRKWEAGRQKKESEAFEIMARELFDYANGCGWPTEKLLIEHLHEVAEECYRYRKTPIISVKFDEKHKSDVLDAVGKAFAQLAGVVPDETSDMVAKPPHYNKYSFQPIDIIAEVSNAYEGSTAFHIGTTLKYLMRAPFKGKLLEDLKKAAYYLNRAIKEMEE